ncbi:triose-phosphate transporter family-domain-containing protein [Ochromonadaceae sp. CCMP2298]|nr:triose-phosphate transporter family-domain-containing protein [Ochromonadaceae sp. CCMP2298]|mmetsp:Transcript_16864/g.37453  ORF Transcript_16864/g.37453 Transcript_16864/m.37453 type:complete len:347 (-) Transcript_16864:72-1112(-)
MSAMQQILAASSAGVICFLYLFVGLALILLNKMILSHLNFPYPIFLSSLGLIASTLFARVVVLLGYAKLSRKEAVEGALWYKRVLPVGFAHAATLSLGNMVYLFLDVSFIQMLKSFTPVIIILFGYLANVDIPSMPVVYSVLVITAGITATCTFRPEFHVLGITIMFLSEVTEAARLILTQFLLQQLKFSTVESLYVLAPASAFWLMLASVVFELPAMLEKDALSIFANNLPTFLMASSMGVVVNFMSFSVIQSTNSLTLKMLGTLRNIVTIVVGVLFYRERLALSEVGGYSVALVGFVSYNLARADYFEKVEWLNADPLSLLRRIMHLPAAEALKDGNIEDHSSV